MSDRAGTVGEPPGHNQRQTEAKALMAALANGERAALARLIALFGPGIRRYAAQALTVPTEAEDVAQEVFLRAWSRAAGYDPDKGAVSSWLYRIAVNLCIDHNRRGGFRRFVGIDSLPEPEDESPGAEAGLAARQRLTQVRRAIKTLPERQRQAILLKAAGELSGTEIAAALGTSEGAVEQLLVRARARLRALMEKED
ncbi:RNA polymerase sigma factor [Celeribacter neptunius]|uniref:RNA polymerase sigma factor n=1 Tax=Celeribacter neptunius TaxID=588602 RepID=A0A1I3WIC4_9RHOB|nr:sigma-70 family RNA polymerase sigma factor [Celeribacter neptunius]SFK06913.1 RNA polymerase sigma-70 factor, ECF subfamily [Celeribacter neptunius]